MDFTWPMNDHRETKDARQNMEEGHSSAIDFVMNAWSLLRGAADKEGSQSSEDGEHTENRVSTIAAASLAAAGGNSQEKDIDFVKQSWALYQQAMEEGWVSDWIESFTAPNVRLCDAVASPTLSTSGHADLTHYYNALLDKIWGNGPASLTWKPRSFRSAGKNTGVVIAEYDIEVTPKSLHHSRQLWIYHVVDEKIAEIQMFPGASPSGHPRAMPPADETPAYATQQTRASPQPSDTEVNLDECLVSSTNLPTSHFTAPATTAVNNSILQPHHHHQQQPQQVPQQQPQQVQVPQQQVQQQQQQVQQQQMPHQMMQQSQQQPQQTQQPFAAFQQAQHQLLEATPAHHLATTTSTPCLETASVPESMPSLATSLSTCYPMPSSVGVSLTRPCAHNSWDNVRIKRGWAILRCRICQSQWRLRPTQIPHCPDFARGAGCCPRGVDCSHLHVHRTREQSSEAKKAVSQRQGATAAVPQQPQQAVPQQPQQVAQQQQQQPQTQAQAQAQAQVQAQSCPPTPQDLSHVQPAHGMGNNPLHSAPFHPKQHQQMLLPQAQLHASPLQQTHSPYEQFSPYTVY